jgi:cell division protease FtsH
MAGGMNIYLPKEDRDYRSKKEMMERITVGLGGRVAEQLILDDISTGASNDIKKVTELARNMVMKYGMSELLGPVLYGSDSEVFLGRDYGHTRNYSDSVAGMIDDEIKTFINEGYKRCEEILSANLEKLHGVAQYLLENETMDGTCFEVYMETGELPETGSKPSQPDEPIAPPMASGADLPDLPDLLTLDDLPDLDEDGKA